MSSESSSTAVPGAASGEASSNSSSKIRDLMAMGYPEEKCTKALHVAGGDMEQAVGFLLMGDKSQRGFDFSSEEVISNPGGGSGGDEIDATVGVTATNISGTLSPDLSEAMPTQQSSSLLQSLYRVHTSTAVDDKTDLEDQLMNMGYTRDQAKQALRVAQGDLEQAANFLLMGDSRVGFVLDRDSSLRNVRNSMTANDAAVAAAMQEEVLFHHALSNQYRDQQNLHPSLAPTYNEGVTPMASAIATAGTNGGPKPKIVATQTFLTTPGAGTFCTCVAASRFLMGGVVSAPFLNNIMEVAIELYRKGGPSNALTDDETIEAVIRRYGRSHLSIQTIRNGDNYPKHGVFMPHDLQHDRGIRKLMTACRNEQQAGWQVILVELKNDSFCVCLPPKGTSNKFWFLDFLPRSNVRAPGAYALVHSSLLQMEESMESVFRIIAIKQESEFVSFTLYGVKKVG